MSSAARAQDLANVEVSAGYQLLSIRSLDETLSVGWYAEVTDNLGRIFGLVLQVGGNYRSDRETLNYFGITNAFDRDVKIHEFLGGIRARAHPTPSVTPFVQLLIGSLHTSTTLSASIPTGGPTPFTLDDSYSSTNTILQAGGGATIRVSRRLGVRAAVDYLHVVDEGGHVVRVAAGAVFGF